MTDGRRAALLATLVVALSAVALVAKFPSQPRIFVELNNAAHAPVFGAMAIVWIHILHRYSALGHWQRYLAAFALAVAIGGVIELIQQVFDRGSERLHLMTDALGPLQALQRTLPLICAGRGCFCLHLLHSYRHVPDRECDRLRQEQLRSDWPRVLPDPSLARMIPMILYG
jgi:hypothetical protein